MFLFTAIEFESTLIIFGLEQKISKLHHSKYGLHNLANFIFLVVVYVFLMCLVYSILW